MSKENKGGGQRPSSQPIKPQVTPPQMPKPGANQGNESFEKGITSAKPPERPKK